MADMLTPVSSMCPQTKARSIQPPELLFIYEFTSASTQDSICQLLYVASQCDNSRAAVSYIYTSILTHNLIITRSLSLSSFLPWGDAGFTIITAKHNVLRKPMLFHMLAMR